VGAVSAFLRRRLDDPNLETTIGVVTAYAAYIAADRVGASGVLAAVGAGVVMSRISMDIFSPGTRVRGHAFWEVAGFMLNALLFLLIGLQLRAAISGIGDTSAVTLAWEAAVVVVVVVTIRALWMLAVPAAVRAVGRRGVRATRPDGREQVILSWSGMRGALSIAAAVSVPLDQSGRALVVFLAFTATFVTLVVPGLTLAPLIRRLGLAQSEQRLRASLEARLEVLRAALSRLDRINTEDEAVSPGTIARLRELYETRASALEARLDGDDGDGSASRFEEERRVERELLVAERQALRRLQAERAAPAEALLEIRHDLDLEASRLRGPGSSSR
jgi:CPA1 family monovalent cation:H+ antiporter